MPDRRNRLLGGTRAASQRAALDASSTTMRIDGQDVEVVPRSVVEQALG